MKVCVYLLERNGLFVGEKSSDVWETRKSSTWKQSREVMTFLVILSKYESSITRTCTGSWTDKTCVDSVSLVLKTSILWHAATIFTQRICWKKKKRYSVWVNKYENNFTLISIYTFGVLRRITTPTFYIVFYAYGVRFYHQKNNTSLQLFFFVFFPEW